MYNSKFGYPRVVDGGLSSCVSEFKVSLSESSLLPSNRSVSRQSLMAVKEIMRMKKNVTSVTLTTLTMSLTTVKLELFHRDKSNWIRMILNIRFSSVQ